MVFYVRMACGCKWFFMSGWCFQGIFMKLMPKNWQFKSCWFNTESTENDIFRRWKKKLFWPLNFDTAILAIREISSSLAPLLKAAEIADSRDWSACLRISCVGASHNDNCYATGSEIYRIGCNNHIYLNYTCVRYPYILSNKDMFFFFCHFLVFYYSRNVC